MAATRAQRTPAAIPAPPELQRVHVKGRFTDDVRIVPRTNSSLHLIPGRLLSEGSEPERRVLLPFADVRLDGLAVRDAPQEIAEDIELTTLFSANLSLENMAFMVLDLTSDLRRMCVEACSLANGELPVDPARMAQVRYFVAHLERQARTCRTRLDRAFGEPAAEAESKE